MIARHAAPFARFIISGGITYVTMISITAAGHELFGLREDIAYAVALGFGILVAFTVGRYFVFRSMAGCPRQQLVRYLAAIASFRLFEYALFRLIHDNLDISYLIVATIVPMISALLKYVIYSRFVYVTP